MSDLFLLSGRQIARISPFFPPAHGVPRVDDRRVVSGIVYVIRHGPAMEGCAQGLRATQDTLQLFHALEPAWRPGPDFRQPRRDFYVLATGGQWKALPKDLPPKSAAHSYFMLWDWNGTLERIHDTPYVALCEAAGNEASPTTAIIDSQSAKAAQGGRADWFARV